MITPPAAARRRARAAALALALAATTPALGRGGARADPRVQWHTRASGPVTILYRPGDEAVAARVAATAGDDWRDLVAQLGGLDEAPDVRLHRDVADLRSAQPLAREVNGEWIVPPRPRRAVSVLAPSGADDAALAAAVHAALARHLVAERSAGRMPDALAEGLVRYLAPPSDAAADRTAAGVAALRAAAAADAVPTWTALVDGGPEVDPSLAPSAARAIVQFLAERGGVEGLVAWPARSASADGWRQAMEATFGAPPARLEAEWRAWLPAYLDHDWRRNALYDEALDGAEALLREGRFAAAATRLDGIAGYARRAGADVAARHDALAARAAAGRVAFEGLDAARAALGAGDYAVALARAEVARDGLQALGLATPQAAAAQLADRARAGARAAADLAAAERAPAWGALGARRAAGAAADDFARLGADLALDRALALRAALARRLAPLGLALVALGALCLVDAWHRRRGLEGVLGA